MAHPAPPPAPAAIDQRIILIGDTGDPSPHEPVLQLLARRVRLIP
jgi:hypothetical protein